MDLALALGWQSVEVMSQCMTERELALWHRYAKEKLFPAERLELYLAQVCAVVARSFTGADVSLSDFIIELQREVSPEEQLEMAKQAFGYNPRVKEA